MKRTFTLLEVVIVVVVVGILAAMILPRMNDDRVELAAKDILEHIRYTQHLALVDDKFDPTKEFAYKEYWQIRFFQKESASADGETPKWAYAIFSDKDSGSGYDGHPNATTGEVAIDPVNKKLLSGGFTISYNDPRTYKAAAIGERYGVQDVRFSSSCRVGTSRRIVFDFLGRPMKGNPKDYDSFYPADKIIQERCRIDFCFNDDCDKNFTITIEPETGFSYISSLNP